MRMENEEGSNPKIDALFPCLTLARRAAPDRTVRFHAAPYALPLHHQKKRAETPVPKCPDRLGPSPSAASRMQTAGS